MRGFDNEIAALVQATMLERGINIRLGTEIGHIEKLRNLLLESELLLSDCQDMLSGYLHILTSDQQQEEQEQ